VARKRTNGLLPIDPQVVRMAEELRERADQLARLAENRHWGGAEKSLEDGKPRGRSRHTGMVVRMGPASDLPRLSASRRWPRRRHEEGPAGCNRA
jgi:hypothetical protein